VYEGRTDSGVKRKLEAALLKAWYAPSTEPLPCYLHALAPFRWLLAAWLSFRRFLPLCLKTAAYRPPVPTWVVGNVVAGGVGKTPLVQALAQHLQARGYHPGIVCRGYKRQVDAHGARLSGKGRKRVHLVQPQDAPQTVGDEAWFLAHTTGAPVGVGVHRAQVIQALLHAHPAIDCVLMDDGWQQETVRPDGALVVWDERGLGNGRLLPQGPLREPWPPRPERRPQALIHMHSPGSVDGCDSDLSPITLPNLPHFSIDRRLADDAVDVRGQGHSPNELRNRPVLALAGIGKPAVFFDMLRQPPWGLTLLPEQTWAGADHADWALEKARLETALNQGMTLVCTEKDAAKLWALWPGHAWQNRIWALPLVLDIPPLFWTWWDEQIDQNARGSKAVSP
jgi:tetraacyldisaccharide 4'-kinase